MCARTDAVGEMQAAAECLTKACEGKIDIDAVLKDWWASLLEDAPADMLHLLSEQK